jgi:predicted regulator of Ras-like GTPase activity (Roadblock/LC7/MglB family)
MSDLEQLIRFPEVTSAVLGDLSGSYQDSYQEADGESVAAVAGFVASNLLQAGELMGLGALRSISVTGAAQARVILLRAGTVLTGTVKPARALGALEKALEAVE